MLPDYRDCQNLCQYKDSPFYETKLVIDRYTVSLFNYRLATNSDFQKPFAKELRGICFVFNQDETLFKRYILLQKFFNLNQTEESLLQNIKEYKLVAINNKEDGSLATFIKLPNGRVLGKSKMGFDNDQAKGITNLYSENKNIKNLVDFCLDNDIVPVFEYVSPFNRIVLKYQVEELILLRLRDNNSGKYLDLNPFLNRFKDIKFAKFENNYSSIEEMINDVVVQEDKEGVVVHCLDNNQNDFMFKVKTIWYNIRHKLFSEDIHRENILIEYILDDNIDDILSQLSVEDVELRNRIDNISNVVKQEINLLVNQIDLLYNDFLDLNSDRKEFALKYVGSQFVALGFRKIGGEDSFQIAKSFILDKTKKLSTARRWLSSKMNIEFVNINYEE